MEGQTPNHTRDREAMGSGKSPEGFRLFGSEVGLQKDIMTLPILPGHLHRLFDLRLIGSRPRTDRPAPITARTMPVTAMTVFHFTSIGLCGLSERLGAHVQRLLHRTSLRAVLHGTTLSSIVA